MTLVTPNSKIIESVNQMMQDLHDALECAKRCMQGAQERSKFYDDYKKGVWENSRSAKRYSYIVTPKRLGLKLQWFKKSVS